MQKVILSLALLNATMWGASNDDVKNKVVKVSPDFDIDKAIQILHFCQQAKSTLSMPNAFMPNRVTTALEFLHVKDPSQFEQVYSQLTVKVLTWTERNLLEAKQKE